MIIDSNKQNLKYNIQSTIPKVQSQSKIFKNSNRMLWFIITFSTYQMIINKMCPLDSTFGVFCDFEVLCTCVWMQALKCKLLMHFMHLMCLHFTFLYFVDDHADVAMESASVGKGIEESFKEKMFFRNCFIPTWCIFRVVLTLKCIISMMINNY